MYSALEKLLRLLRSMKPARPRPIKLASRATSPLDEDGQRRLLLMATALGNALEVTHIALRDGYDARIRVDTSEGTIERTVRDQMERELGVVHHEMFVLWCSELSAANTTSHALQLAKDRKSPFYSHFQPAQ